MTEPTAVRAADTVEAVSYVIDEDPDPQRVVSDLSRRPTQGAALAYALYHSGKDCVGNMPPPVLRAYGAACRADQVAERHRQRSLGDLIEHEEVLIGTDAKEALVDEGIAALIMACWQRDIDTLFSCQGGPGRGYAYISMPPDDATRFARIILADDGEEWRRRVRDQANTPQPDRGQWTWDSHPRDGDLMVTVRFPPSDIPEITRRLGESL